MNSSGIVLIVFDLFLAAINVPFALHGSVINIFAGVFCLGIAIFIAVDVIRDWKTL